MLNAAQFELLVNNDISCTLHPELVFHEEKTNKGVMVTPCFTVSCLLKNFHVPRCNYNILQGTFQHANGKPYLENYSTQAFDFALISAIQ